MQFSSENTKGVAMDFWEKKYESSPRFDISGNSVVREDLVLSPTVSSTEIDSRMVTIEEVTVPNSPAQHDTKSSSLPMTHGNSRTLGQPLLGEK